MPRFSEVFKKLPIDALVTQSMEAPTSVVENILRKQRAHQLSEFAALLSPNAQGYLESMAAISQHITQKYYGKNMRLFAPIYLSNECVNKCKYCGFSRENKIHRITLSVDQAINEIKLLAKQGFRSLLLVAGEHPRHVSNGYVEEVVKRSLEYMPSIAIELGPMETKGYIPLVKAGCEGLIVYQESYHKPTYIRLHTAGPKRKFEWRMDTPERAYDAGFRRLGISALYGLYDWRYEAIATAAHAKHLLQYCWKSQITISVPRMRPATGGFQPQILVSDREMVQLITAFRLFLPHVGITLSTREPKHIRDGLIPLGVTNMSAGSSTEPGGYSHFDEATWTPQKRETGDGEQFHIADERPPSEIAEQIRQLGYEPVWKDFDRSLVQK